MSFPEMNPPKDLEAARRALLSASERMRNAEYRLHSSSEYLRSQLEVTRHDVEAAVESLERAVEHARAWELSRGPDQPRWALQAERIADDASDCAWALAGVVVLYFSGDTADARSCPGALRALAVSIDLCLLRVAAVIPEVRHG